MVGDDVEHDLDAALLGGGRRAVEVVERAVLRLDVEVVGDVVAVIGCGDGKHGDNQMASMPRSRM